MAGTLIKQAAPYLLTSKYLNDINDPVVQGQLTGVPSGINATQGAQTLPGDRFCFDTAGALAVSDTTVATLYGGIYMYVRTSATSVGAPARGKLAYWDLSVDSSLYQVTPDETGAAGANQIAGVFINAITAGQSGFIQIAGKASMKFRAVLTGVAATGASVFAAAAGAGADLGTVDIFASDANPATLADVALLTARFLGTAEALPVAGAISVVSIKSMLTHHI